MTEPNLYSVGYDVGFEDGFKEAEARIKKLKAQIEEQHYGVTAAHFQGYMEGKQQTEAKLAKAVEELENMQKVPRSDASYGILMVMISYALAELKGQDDE